MSEGEIVVVPYSPWWPERFEAEAFRIRGALGAAARRIEHVGGTAVPGLQSRSTIDILVSVASLDPREAYATPLERLGYFEQADRDLECRSFEMPEEAAQVLVCVEGTQRERDFILLRDFLRTHPELVRALGELKRHVAIASRTNRSAYREAKSPFTEQILQSARATAPRRPRG